MEREPGRIDYSLKEGTLVGKPSASSTVTVTEDSTPSKTEKQLNLKLNGAKGNDGEILPPTTENVNQGTGPEAYNLGEQASGAALAMLSTGNVNTGPGAGAFNEGKNAGAINGHDGVINFRKSTKEEIESSAPSDGNRNIGPAAGAYNKGEGAGGINNCKGTINF